MAAFGNRTRQSAGVQGRQGGPSGMAGGGLARSTAVAASSGRCFNCGCSLKVSNAARGEASRRSCPSDDQLPQSPPSLRRVPPSRRTPLPLADRSDRPSSTSASAR
jgi:hypothetical protein